MTMKQRAEISKKAKLCLNCHDPEYTYKGFDRTRNCGKGKKSRSSCKNAACSQHMWICEKHKNENEDSLERRTNIRRTTSCCLVYLPRRYSYLLRVKSKVKGRDF